MMATGRGKVPGPVLRKGAPGPKSGTKVAYPGPLPGLFGRKGKQEAMAVTYPSPLRLLLIAEACNPTWTSVPLVGYNFARALSRRSDLHLTVLTHVRNKPAVANDVLAKKAT